MTLMEILTNENSLGLFFLLPHEQEAFRMHRENCEFLQLCRATIQLIKMKSFHRFVRKNALFSKKERQIWVLCPDAKPDDKRDDNGNESVCDNGYGSDGAGFGRIIEGFARPDRMTSGA